MDRDRELCTKARRLRRAEGQAPHASPREFVSGESVRYLGAALPLEGRSARDRRGKAARRMAARARAGGKAADRSRASRFGVLVPPSRRRTASGTGGGMAVEGGYSNAPRHRRGPTERWGSCNQRGTIRLNWRIIQAPMRLIDYVVVHELCIYATAATVAATGRPSDGLCRTTSGAERNCGSAESGWRGRIAAASCSSVVISKRNVWAERA